MAESNDRLSPADSSGSIYIDESEEEIFFAPFSEKQLEFARRLMKRRTEVYCPGCRLNRPSLKEFRQANNCEGESLNLEATDDSAASITESLYTSSLAHWVEDIKQSDNADSEDDMASFDDCVLSNINDSLEVHARRSSEFIKKSSSQNHDCDSVLETSFERDSVLSPSHYISAQSDSMSEGLHVQHHHLTPHSLHSLSSLNSFHSEEQNSDEASLLGNSLQEQFNKGVGCHKIHLTYEEMQLSDRNSGVLTLPARIGFSVIRSSPDIRSSLNKECSDNSDFYVPAPPASPEMSSSLLSEDSEMEGTSMNTCDHLEQPSVSTHVKLYCEPTPENISSTASSPQIFEMESNLKDLVSANTEVRLEHAPDLTTRMPDSRLYTDSLPKKTSVLDAALKSDSTPESKNVRDRNSYGPGPKEICISFKHLAVGDQLSSKVEQPTSSLLSAVSEPSSIEDNVENFAEIIDNDFFDAKEQGCQTSFAFNLLTDSTETIAKKTVELANISHDSELVPQQCPVIMPPPSSSEKKCTRIPVFKLSAPTSNTRVSSILKPLPNSQAKVPVIFNKDLKQSPMQRVQTLSCPGVKKRFEHIASPVSKYIHDAPPPPLIANSQPLPRPVAGFRRIAKSSSCTKIPMPKIRGNSRLIMTDNKQTLSRNKTGTKGAQPKARTKLEFDCAVEKENFEDSIIGKLGLTLEDLNKIENKKLKVEVVQFVKHKKALFEYLERQKMETQIKATSTSDPTSLPCCIYKGPSSLILMQKELELVTKLHTLRNKQVKVASPCRPLVLKHIGQRKHLHWADHKASEVEKLSTPSHVIDVMPRILSNSQVNSSCLLNNESSTIEASIVEVVDPIQSQVARKHYYT